MLFCFQKANRGFRPILHTAVGGVGEFEISQTKNKKHYAKPIYQKVGL